MSQSVLSNTTLAPHNPSISLGNTSLGHQAILDTTALSPSLLGTLPTAEQAMDAPSLPTTEEPTIPLNDNPDSYQGSSGPGIYKIPMRMGLAISAKPPQRFLKNSPDSHLGFSHLAMAVGFEDKIPLLDAAAQAAAGLGAMILAGDKLASSRPAQDSGLSFGKIWEMAKDFLFGNWDDFSGAAAMATTTADGPIIMFGDDKKKNQGMFMAKTPKWTLENPYGNPAGDLEFSFAAPRLADLVPQDTPNLAQEYGFDANKILIDGRLQYLLREESWLPGFLGNRENQRKVRAMIRELGASAVYFTPNEGFSGRRGVLVLIGRTTYHWIDAIGILQQQRGLRVSKMTDSEKDAIQKAQEKLDQLISITEKGLYDHPQVAKNGLLMTAIHFQSFYYGIKNTIDRFSKIRTPEFTTQSSHILSEAEAIMKSFHRSVYFRLLVLLEKLQSFGRNQDQLHSGTIPEEYGFQNSEAETILTYFKNQRNFLDPSQVENLQAVSAQFRELHAWISQIIPDRSLIAYDDWSQIGATQGRGYVALDNSSAYSQEFRDDLLNRILAYREANDGRLPEQIRDSFQVSINYSRAYDAEAAFMKKLTELESKLGIDLDPIRRRVVELRQWAQAQIADPRGWKGKIVWKDISLAFQDSIDLAFPAHLDGFEASYVVSDPLTGRRGTSIHPEGSTANPHEIVDSDGKTTLIFSTKNEWSWVVKALESLEGGHGAYHLPEEFREARSQEVRKIPSGVLHREPVDKSRRVTLFGVFDFIPDVIVDANRLVATIKSGFRHHEAPMAKSVVDAKMKNPSNEKTEDQLYRELFAGSVRQAEFMSWDPEGRSVSIWSFPPHQDVFTNPNFLAYQRRIEASGSDEERRELANHVIQAQAYPSMMNARLQVIATHRDYEDEGLASQRMYPSLDLSDAHGWNSDLRAHGEKFIAWFQRFGYEIEKKFNFVDSDFDSYVMVRQARPLMEVTQAWAAAQGIPFHEDVLKTLTGEYDRVLHRIMDKIKATKRHTAGHITFQTSPENRASLIDLMRSRAWKVDEDAQSEDSIIVEVMGELGK